MGRKCKVRIETEVRIGIVLMRSTSTFSGQFIAEAVIRM